MEEKIDLTVIIPVFNEEKTIAMVLDQVKELARLLTLEIIVVNDASTDSSLSVIERHKDIILINHPENKGKTTCIKSALQRASGELVIIQDGDLEYPPSNIPKLVDALKNSSADIVYGKRDFDNVVLVQTKLGLWITNLLIKLFFGEDIKDVNTGHKLFYRNDLLKMDFEFKRFSFCVEITYALLQKGKQIIEVPIDYFPRSVEEGKKIKFVDGVEIVLTLLYLRLRDFFR